MPLWVPLVIFLSVTGMIVAAGIVYNQWQSTQQMSSRLDTFTGARVSSDAEHPNLLRDPIGWDSGPSLLDQFRSPLAKLEENIRQSDLNIPITTFLLLSAALGAIGCVAVLVMRLPPFMVPAGALTALVPFGYVHMKKKQRLKKFSEQMPDALELISRALRAGHTLPSGLQMVSHEMPPPIGNEFQRTYEEQNLGVPMEVALKNLGKRVPNVDLGFFVTAVLIQRQTGGDLSEILDKLGYIIRERFKIFGQVAALTAEGRLSGWILIALPLVLFGVLLKLNRPYVMMLFETELGNKMLIGAGIAQVVGAIVINKIVKIRV